MKTSNLGSIMSMRQTGVLVAGIKTLPMRVAMR
jgi:hypothetical protein